MATRSSISSNLLLTYHRPLTTISALRLYLRSTFIAELCAGGDLGLAVWTGGLFLFCATFAAETCALFQLCSALNTGRALLLFLHLRAAVVAESRVRRVLRAALGTFNFCLCWCALPLLSLLVESVDHCPRHCVADGEARAKTCASARAA